MLTYFFAPILMKFRQKYVSEHSKERISKLKKSPFKSSEMYPKNINQNQDKCFFQ